MKTANANANAQFLRAMTASGEQIRIRNTASATQQIASFLAQQTTPTTTTTTANITIHLEQTTDTDHMFYKIIKQYGITKTEYYELPLYLFTVDYLPIKAFTTIEHCISYATQYIEMRGATNQ